MSAVKTRSRALVKLSILAILLATTAVVGVAPNAQAGDLDECANELEYCVSQCPPVTSCIRDCHAQFRTCLLT